MKRIKVILLYSSGHLGSSIVLNKLMQVQNIEIVGLVKAKAVSISKPQVLQKKYTKFGPSFCFLLAWQKIIQTVAFTLSKFTPENKARLKQSYEFSDKLDIHECTDINSQETHTFISKHQPDILISAFFPQILKNETINIPKIGVLNLHPGLLPEFKGAMSYLHVLEQKKKKAGVTIHWMDEGIDTGEIISQKSFKIKNYDTQETIMVKSAYIGCKLLQRIVNLINSNKPIPKIVRKKKGNYYSMPTKTIFKSYLQTRRFFRLRDIFGLITLKPLKESLKTK